ncbi:laccase-11-like [Prunus yedoensis var. nudiflora]|uniref:Laccase-11-like n=1 Tax=Prunus yedoensis var. nudiflora TaxID=2094558 RepID=A0A314YYC1_PRUYE|nr:laccase-11-like [Prunus yedoensis var. nudiflora]
MAARPFMDAPVAIDNKTATGIFQYRGIPNTVLPSLPQLPASNDTAFALSYNKKLKSLNTPTFPVNVPLKVNRKLFYTIGFGKESCPTCLNGTRFVASLNNISFEMPRVGLLQAHYFNLKGVFKTDFPDRPQTPFNYTGAPLTASLGTSTGTRLSKIAFNSTVELVLQDTNLLTVESHPFHLHGYNFFVVGTGLGILILPRTLLNTTWLIQLRETQLEFPQVVGPPFVLELIIQAFGSCTVIWSFIPGGD